LWSCPILTAINTLVALQIEVASVTSTGLIERVAIVDGGGCERGQVWFVSHSPGARSKPTQPRANQRQSMTIQDNWSRRAAAQVQRAGLLIFATACHGIGCVVCGRGFNSRRGFVVDLQSRFINVALNGE
jgi:hypothetical protein